MSVRFFVGLHQPNHAEHFDQACISIRRLWNRKKPIDCGAVLVDSGAFTEINLYGGFRTSVDDYARELLRLHEASIINIQAAVAQDYMCEPFMLAKTGLTIDEHQRLTVERYDDLASRNLPFPVLPVLQGFAPEDYVRHIQAYGDRLTPGMWVGVGSVCKRNGSPQQVAQVLRAIKRERPDILIHGFGIKQTSLLDHGVREFLHSADSMAWSFAARRQGRDANSWKEAKAFSDKVGQAAALPLRHLEIFAAMGVPA